MSSKKWLLLFAVSIVLTLALYAGFNLLTDPFGVFGDPLFHWDAYSQTNNPRIGKIEYLERHIGEYDSFIIGSSSAAALDPAELEAYCGGRWYNLFVYGCDTSDYVDFTRYLLENGAPRRILLNLGINEAVAYDVGEDDLNNRQHWRAKGTSAAAFYLDYLLPSPGYAAEKLRSAARDTELPQPFDVFLPESGCYDKRVRDVERIGDPAQYEARYAAEFAPPDRPAQALPCIPQCAAAVAEIKRLCEENGVALTVAFSPAHIAQWERWTPETLRDYKTQIAQVTDYWDFSYSSVSYDSRYFYDATHFRNAVGSMMLSKMYGGARWYPADFGTWVGGAGDVDGLFDAAAPAADDSRDVPVLMYHHLDPSPENDMAVSPETFAAHLRALRDAGYETVLPRDLIDYVYRGTALPEKPVLITFDDGYRSNYELAFPLLREYGMKAAIFAIGSSVGKSEYKDTGQPITPHFSYEEAREMIDSGLVEVQSHTWDMHQWAAFEPAGAAVRASMAPLPGETDGAFMDAVVRDLTRAGDELLAGTGRPLTALAYPNGVYSPAAEAAAREAGVLVTFSTASDSRNTLVRGLPQTLCALCRHKVTQETSPAALLALAAS